MLQADRDAGVFACDLDGTLLRVNSFPHFVMFALAAFLRRARLRPLLRLIGALTRRKIFGLPHEQLKLAVAATAEQIPPREIEAWASRMASRYGNVVIAEVVSSWQGVTVLTTSAPQIYAEALAGVFAFDLVHGTQIIDGELRDNVGRAKVARLNAERLGEIELTATDDERADRPLLERSRRGLLVGIDGDVSTLEMTKYRT